MATLNYEETQQVKKSVEVNPCIKCGSEDIRLYDCGYSSFNYGGGECQSCKNKHSTSVDWNVSKKDLAAIWNAGNPTKEQQIKSAEEHIAKWTEKLEQLKASQ